MIALQEHQVKNLTVLAVLKCQAILLLHQSFHYGHFALLYLLLEEQFRKQLIM